MIACCGGWTIHESVSEEHKEVLNTALAGFVGCTYEPLLVATQVVNGTNYIFIAKSTPVVPQPITGLVKIAISATPAGNTPKIESIQSLI